MPQKMSYESTKKILLICGIFISFLLILCVAVLLLSFVAGCIGFSFDRPGFIVFVISVLLIFSIHYFRSYIHFDRERECKEPEFVARYFWFIDRDRIRKMDSNRVRSEACIMQSLMLTIMLSVLFYYIFHDNAMCPISVLNWI